MKQFKEMYNDDNSPAKTKGAKENGKDENIEEKDKITNDQLLILLDNMLNTSIMKSDDERTPSSFSSTNDKQMAASSIEKKENDFDDENEKVNNIITHIKVMFHRLSFTIKTFMITLNGNNTKIDTPPPKLRLDRSSENLLSENNVRVTAAKFKIELSKGERKKLSTLSRVKTLRESRVAFNSRPNHILLQSINAVLQQEQDLIFSSSEQSSTLVKEDENGK
jgi:hypothetical protein